MTVPARHVWMIVSVALFGCNQLIGIDDAYVDPTLEETPDEPLDATSGEAGADPGSSSSESSSTGGEKGDSKASGGTTTGGDGTGGTGSNGHDSVNGDATSGSDGSGGTASASGGTGGTGGTASLPEQTLCDEYCDGIMEECTDANLQYRDRNQCMRLCSMLDEGTVGQVDENTVACRLKFVGDARYGAGTELAAYCRRAGPGGDGSCGDNCDGYCSLMMQVCTAQSAGEYHFESEAECLDTCAALPLGEHGYEASGQLIADENTVQCRLFHVASAAMLDPQEHCEHATGVTLCEEDSGE